MREEVKDVQKWLRNPEFTSGRLFNLNSLSSFQIYGKPDSVFRSQIRHVSELILDDFDILPRLERENNILERLSSDF